MMKQQLSATSLPPSKLCRLLIIAFAFKLAVLGLLILEPVLPYDSGSFSLARLFGNDSSGRSAANAATGESPGAPPALAPVPSAQNAAPTPPQAAGSVGSAPEQAERVLPSIGERPSAPAPGSVPPAGNGTAPADLSTDAVRDSLARRQEDLARKEQELRVVESELAGRLEKMKMLESRLSSMIKDAETANDAKFRHLVDVLSNMKARQAAAVVETLDQKIAVRVLAGMRGRQAGEILTYVKPEIAAKLTEALARMQLPLE